MIEPQTIAIVGTGLLGGSIGLGLRAAGHKGRLVGVGRRPQTLEKAIAHGCIDEGTCDVAQAAKESDLMILATPLGAFESTLRQLAPAQHERLVITDVGSVKGVVCAMAGRVLRHPQLFVGSHPMAGSELQGPEHARKDLFVGRPCVVVRGAATEAALARVQWLWDTLRARAFYMSAEEHDRKVAAISHLPHAVAALLLQNALAEQAFDVASSGLADTTRVASGDPELWADIFLLNSTAVMSSLRPFGEQLERLGQLIAQGDRAGLVALLRSSKESRDVWLQRSRVPPQGE